jgi:nitroimidazol reductase NimA-like FMN-containing flavoprotein (pyridoxamine 5'-phosphate oxidase superfamily)
MKTATPVLSRLDEADARSLLARIHVGRIAYSLHDRVDIEPVHYAYEGEWVFGRTSMGTKLATLAHHPWCAFEVDEVRALFDWSSVVVKGSFHLLDPEGGATDAYRRALSLLSALVPDTFSADDPAPQRTILFGIYIHEITGRTARMGQE